MTSIATSRAVSEEVVRYCEAHNLLGPLEAALRLAEECFSPIERIEVAIEADPEVVEDKVVVDIWVRMSVEEGLKCDALYTKRWVSSMSPTVMLEIVLLYHPI